MDWIPGVGWPTPPSTPGVPYDRWHARMVAAAIEQASAMPLPVSIAPARAAATARDGYGWRGLRGTSYLGPQPKEE